MFGFGKKGKGTKEAQASAPASAPGQEALAAYDRFLEDLERQGAQIRKSAATLVALRSELRRDDDRYGRVIQDLDQRLVLARNRKDVPAEAVLRRDRREAEAAQTSTREALARAEEDATALLAAGADLSKRIAELKRERASARARLAVGHAVTNALRERYERFEQVMALEAARDEVEKAQALAQIYREDRAKEGSG